VLELLASAPPPALDRLEPMTRDVRPYQMLAPMVVTSARQGRIFPLGNRSAADKARAPLWSWWCQAKRSVREAFQNPNFCPGMTRLPADPGF